MAEIPTQTASVGDTVLSGGALPLAASPDALGAGIGEAVDNAASEADRVHLEAMRNYNRTSVLDAHNQLDDFNQQKLFDPKSGLLNQNTGAQAPAAVDKTMADYDAHVSKVAGSLTNDQQKLQFARMAQENRRVVQSHLNNYETRQVQGYQESVTQATAKNAATAAVQNVNGVITSPDPALADPTKRAAAVDRAASSSIEMGVAALKDQFRSVNPTAPANDPRLVEQVQAYQSAAHYGVIQSLLSQSKDMDASAYYTAHKPDLIGQEADAAARQVDAGSTAGQAMRTAPALVYNPDGQVKSRGDVYAALDGDKTLRDNPKLYEATAAQVDRLLRHHDEAQASDDRSAFDSAYDRAQTSPVGYADPAVQSLAATITSPELRERFKALSQKPDKSIPDDSDDYIFATARLAENAPDPKTGKRPSDEPPQAYRGSMSPGDFKRYVSSWESKRGETVKSEQERGTESATKIVSEALGKAQIKDKLPNGDMNQDAIDFRRQVNDIVLANGGLQKVGTKGVQDICDDLMWQKTEIKGPFQLEPAEVGWPDGPHL